MKYKFKVELRKINSRKKAEINKTIISKEKKQLVLAHQIIKYMDENNIKTLKEMSRVTNVSVARLSQIVGFLYSNEDTN